MKRQCVSPLVVLSLIWGVVQSDAKSDMSETITFSKAGLSFEKLDGYDVVKVSGCYLTLDIAAPMLPVRNVYLIIPPEATVIRAEVTSCESEDLEGTYTLTQPSLRCLSAIPTDPGPGSNRTTHYTILSLLIQPNASDTLGQDLWVGRESPACRSIRFNTFPVSEDVASFVGSILG